MFRHYAKDNRLLCIFDAFENTELIIRIFAVAGMHDFSVKVKKDDSHLAEIEAIMRRDDIPSFVNYPYIFEICKFIANNLDNDIKQENIYKDDKIHKSKILIANNLSKVNITLQINDIVRSKSFEKNDSFLLSNLSSFVNSLVYGLYYKR